MAILAVAPKPDYAGALALIARVPADLAAARVRLGITAAVQAKQIGVTAATLTRLSAGSVPTQTTIIASMRWLASHS